MLPVLISFPTIWAMAISLGGGALYAAWHLWTGGKAGRSSAGWGVVVGAGGAIAAKIYGKPVPLHTYGLLVAGAFLVATWILTREVRRLNPIYGKMRKGRYPTEDDMLDMSFWVLVSSLVGSRILFIIVNWDHYSKNPRNILSLSGGLVFYGGLIGAILACLVFARQRKIPFLELGDIAIPSVSFGHMMGRLGCFAAGCCWGKQSPADYLFGARFPQDALAFSSQVTAGLIPASAEHTLPLHPTQLYESAGELAIFFLLLLAKSRWKRFHGQVLTTYFIVYSVLRVTIEAFRSDYERGMLLRWPAQNPLLLSISQVISLGFAAAGIAILVWAIRGRRATA